MDSKLKESILCEFWHLKIKFYAKDKMDIWDTVAKALLIPVIGTILVTTSFHAYAMCYDLNLPPLPGCLRTLLHLFEWKHCNAF
jgi:hypothetical protein